MVSILISILINFLIEIFKFILSGHILLSNEQIFQISRHIICWWQIIFYWLLIFLYLILTHKICKFFWWWSKLWWINKTHIITYFVMLSIWLILWKICIHPSHQNIEKNADIWAYKIANTVEYKEWEWYLFNFIK